MKLYIPVIMQRYCYDLYMGIYDSQTAAQDAAMEYIESRDWLSWRLEEVNTNIRFDDFFVKYTDLD